MQDRTGNKHRTVVLPSRKEGETHTYVRITNNAGECAEHIHLCQ